MAQRDRLIDLSSLSSVGYVSGGGDNCDGSDNSAERSSWHSGGSKFCGAVTDGGYSSGSCVPAARYWARLLWLGILLFGVLALPQTSVDAADYIVTPANYTNKLSQLKPGDALLLMPGVYKDNLLVYDLAGTEQRPITIKCPVGPKSRRAVFLATKSANTVSIKNSQYIIIKNLYLDDNGYSGPHAIKAESPSRWAHHITIENCIIDGYGEGQQQVGISTKCPTWNWIIRGNQIIGAGTGMYLGNSDGSAEFVNGIIENNIITDTVGYNIEIKHQNTRTQLDAGMPRSGKTIVRGNTFVKQKHSKRNEGGRPNLLIGHYPPEKSDGGSGVGAHDVYEVYGNTFYENCDGERLFQAEGNVWFYNNLLINSHGPGLSIQAHNDKPKCVRVFFNTIVCRDKGISVSGGDARYQQKVIGNLVCSSGIDASDQAQNISAGYTDAQKYLQGPIGPSVADCNLLPLPRAAGQVVNAESFKDAMAYKEDKNGERRDGRFRGAYASPNSQAQADNDKHKGRKRGR